MAPQRLPRLGWSHYRALMRVEKVAARDFYEREAIACGWSKLERMRFDDEDFYVDLVFYNYLLRCFVLIDLKAGALTHQDIGQMDGYVRMFDARAKPAGDNPTYLPSEAELRRELLRERRLIEARRA